MLYFPSLVCWNGKFGSQLCGLFDSTQNRPCLGSCGHSVCSPCLDKNPRIRCPICGLENAFGDRKINYTALNFIDMFSENCVEVYKNWWQVNQETIGQGYCTHCATDCESLRLCVTCELSANSPILEYHEQEAIVSLKIDTVSVAKLSLSLKCAHCIADNGHENHRVIKLKDVKNSAIQIKRCSNDVASRFLKKGLENTKGKDCKLRYDRMMYIFQVLSQEIKMLCEEAIRTVLFETDRKSSTEKYAKIDRYLESLKAQWIDYQKDPEESCECLKLWKECTDIRMAKEAFTAMSFTDIDIDTVNTKCPLNFDKNQGLRLSISFLMDEKKKLKQITKAETFEKPEQPKPSDIPATSEESSNSSEPPHSTFNQIKSLYDHLKELTKVVESLVKLVPEDRVHEIPKIPEMPTEPVE